MKNFVSIIILVYFFPIALFAQAASIPPAAQKLISAYPQYLSGYADNELIFKDGTKLTWDDGIKNKPWQHGIFA
jgi:hypothetical protein